MINLSDIVESLHLVFDSKQQRDVYLFGSILKADTVVSDVDVLIVYRPSDDVDSFKNAIAPLTFRLPLDVTYMSEAEEQEFNFIREQGAKRLHELLA